MTQPAANRLARTSTPTCLLPRMFLAIPLLLGTGMLLAPQTAWATEKEWPSTCDGLRLEKPHPTSPCRDIDSYHDVRSVDEFLAWAETPETSVRISADLDFGGASIEVATNCRIRSRRTAELGGLENLFMSALSIDIWSGITATGTVALFGEEQTIIRRAAPLEAEILFADGDWTDLHGDTNLGKGMCLLGLDTIIRRESLHTGSAHEIFIQGDEIDLQGDFDAAAAVTAIATRELRFRNHASISGGTERLRFESGHLLLLNGDITDVSESLVLRGDDVEVPNRGLVADSTGLCLHAESDLTVRGELTGLEGAHLTAGEDMLFGELGEILGNGNILIDVGDCFVGRGQVHDNESVAINSHEYSLDPAHDFTGNGSCQLTGVALPEGDPVPPVGCTAE